MSTVRRRTKDVLGRLPDRRPARGATLLIWHRVGGGTGDELDVPAADFDRQLDALEGHDVVSLDAALDRLEAGDDRPTVVLTFDDGFADVHGAVHPRLADRGWPYTVYLASGFVGRPMQWEGSSATGTSSALGLTWEQLGELVESGLCTVGNHTHDHVPPDRLSPEQLDRCSAEIESHLGLRPRHFAYPWGVPVPALRAALAARFRSAATGEVGRNRPGDDLLALRRVPVRRTDPPAFFAAKLRGGLLPERSYARLVATAKRARARARARA